MIRWLLKWVGCSDCNDGFEHSTVVATFEYDALGRRIETVDAIAGTTTRYYYDEQRVVLRTQISFSSRT
ncbi:MAG TPA: RHS repeat protein, partial [Anaerohalosphaeraceae bacterium]|nr:RHS repeat protein [Anaerohalosphaeraceae bacterium]HRT24679.1 RHS repeat protein [Anaerohalosphaeraceae bacterium]